MSEPADAATNSGRSPCSPNSWQQGGQPRYTPAPALPDTAALADLAAINAELGALLLSHLAYEEDELHETPGRLQLPS